MHARQIQFKAVCFTTTLIINQFLRRLEEWLVIEGDPICWICGTHLAGETSGTCTHITHEPSTKKQQTWTEIHSLERQNKEPL